MNPTNNPYTPGAGTQPSELAGRDDILRKVRVALDRIKVGRPARSMCFYGLRGVGKTVLLFKVRQEAENKGYITINLEMPENKSLPSVLIPALKSALIRLSRVEYLRDIYDSAQGTLANFASRMKLKYNDVEIAFDRSPDQTADSCDLEVDMLELFETIGKLVKGKNTALLLSIDELQYVEESQLGALIAVLHQLGQHGLPIILMAAGLPQIVGSAGRAKSYAERLFEFVHIDRLDDEAAKSALCSPARRENVEYTDEAVQIVLRQTQGYPYFVQEWGKHCWDMAQSTPIERIDAEHASERACIELDESFFRVRYDRLTPKEKIYLRAMAEMGSGPHRSGEVAKKLGKLGNEVAPIRNSLINKGMIYAPSHGDTAFTVPLFDQFMKRVMPILMEYDS